MRGARMGVAQVRDRADSVRIGRVDVVKENGGALAPAPIEIATPAGQLIVRLATRDDDAELRRLFSSITMEAALALRVDREPEFFAMYDVQDGDAVWEPWVGE